MNYDPGSLGKFTNYNNRSFYNNNNNNYDSGGGFKVLLGLIGLAALVCLVLFAPDILEGKKTYTVTFMDLEGVYLVDDKVEPNSTILEPAPPTKEGYRFLGWYLDNDVYAFGSPVTSDLYLRAKWLNIGTNQIEEVKIPESTPAPNKSNNNQQRSNANSNNGNKTNNSNSGNSGNNQNTNTNTNTNTNNGGNKTKPSPTPTPSSKTNPGKTSTPTPTITSEPTPSPTPTPTPIGEPKPEEPPKEPTPTPVPTPEPTPEPKLFRVQILSDNPIIKGNPTLTSPTSSNGEKGLYRMSVSSSFGGGTGFTYFFRGDVNNNIVEFAGFTWRIVRINENGTIRLILDSLINNNTGYVFNGSWQGYEKLYYSNSGSYIQNALENWYSTNITGANANKVAGGSYFCEAAKVRYSGDNYSGGNTTLIPYYDYTPSLNCSTDGNGKGYVTSYVGLLTYDEALLAGGYRDTANNSYYLYKTATNSSITKGWWLMSPGGVVQHNNAAVEWLVNASGGLYMDVVRFNYFGIRPVINLKSSVTVIKNSNGHYVVQ